MQKWGYCVFDELADETRPYYDRARLYKLTDRGEP